MRAALPRRDPEARARLEVVGSQAGPATLAHERSLIVPGELGDLLLRARGLLQSPGQPGGLIRGATITVDGAVGAGTTSAVFELAAAVTAVGEWAAVVELDSRASFPPGSMGSGSMGPGSMGPGSRGTSIGADAAFAAGVTLERFAVIRRVPLDRWATVVATLLDGMSLVITDVPRSARLGDARRLTARARERGAVLVVQGAWPCPASLHITARGGTWHGLEEGGGVLSHRARCLHVDAHGVHAHGLRVDAHGSHIADVG